MISIGYYENDGKLYVFAVVDGMVTRAHLTTEGLVQALMDAGSLQIAAEKVKAWIRNAQDPVVPAGQVEASLGALVLKYPDLERIDAPQIEVNHPALRTSSLKNQTIAWTRYSILATGIVSSDEERISQFREFVGKFVKDTSDKFEEEVLARFQVDGPLEPGM
jgi:hypothetical protein